MHYFPPENRRLDLEEQAKVPMFNFYGDFEDRKFKVVEWSPVMIYECEHCGTIEEIEKPYPMNYKKPSQLTEAEIELVYGAVS